MRVSNGETVTPVFPIDRCGKPCEILHCALEHFHRNCARGKELNAVPCPSRTPIPALKAELSTLRRSGTFYFALTVLKRSPMSDVLLGAGVLLEFQAVRRFGLQSTS